VNSFLKQIESHSVWPSSLSAIGLDTYMYVNCPQRLQRNLRVCRHCQQLPVLLLTFPRGFDISCEQYTFVGQRIDLRWLNLVLTLNQRIIK
jgi:hypothetical protein